MKRDESIQPPGMIAAVQASEPREGAAIIRSRGVFRRCRMRSYGPADLPAFEGPPCRVGRNSVPDRAAPTVRVSSSACSPMASHA